MRRDLQLLVGRLLIRVLVQDLVQLRDARRLALLWPQMLAQWVLAFSGSSGRPTGQGRQVQAAWRCTDMFQKRLRAHAGAPSI